MQVVERWRLLCALAASTVRPSTRPSRRRYGDADLFTEVVRTLDKHLYFLEAHLQA